MVPVQVQVVVEKVVEQVPEPVQAVVSVVGNMVKKIVDNEPVLSEGLDSMLLDNNQHSNNLVAKPKSKGNPFAYLLNRSKPAVPLRPVRHAQSAPGKPIH